ncbi:MAG: transglycosylase, partial [Rhodospirillales bacterium]|nr:transglycosylase [Rhodospirillales bacterium]
VKPVITHRRTNIMSILGWIILGLIAGFIASKLVNKRGEGLIMDIVLGIVGAIVGGFLFTRFGAAGVTGFNLYSMLVAVVGAVVILVIYHAIFGRRAT